MSKIPDVRWRQRFQSFGKAFAQLSAYNQKTADEVAAAILANFMSEFAAFHAKFIELDTLEP